MKHLLNWTNAAAVTLAGVIVCCGQDYVQKELARQCPQDVEPHVSACHDGKSRVWEYSFTDAKDPGKTYLSWTYRSREEAEQARERDRHLCQMVDQYFDHTDCTRAYGDPFCAACGTGVDPVSDRARSELREGAGRVLDDWQQRLEGAIEEFLDTSENGNPLKNVGSVLKDYASVLEASYKKLTELKRQLATADRQWQLTEQNLDVLMRSEAADRTTVARAFKVLPREFQDRMHHRQPTLGGDWATQRILDFDSKTVVVQTVSLSTDTINVRIAPEGQRGTRSYTLQRGDFIAANTTVEATPDGRWIVTLHTNGRTIEDVTTRDNGQVVRELKSRVYLFFSTERAAREAARLMSSL